MPLVALDFLGYKSSIFAKNKLFDTFLTLFYHKRPQVQPAQVIKIFFLIKIFTLKKKTPFLFSFAELETIVLDWLGESAFKNSFTRVTQRKSTTRERERPVSYSLFNSLIVITFNCTFIDSHLFLELLQPTRKRIDYFQK